MTLEQAVLKLERARKKYRAVLEEIRHYNQVIASLGGHPDRKVRHKRNLAIYRRFKNGASYSEIARSYGLSGTTVANICKRMRMRSGDNFLLRGKL